MQCLGCRVNDFLNAYLFLHVWGDHRWTIFACICCYIIKNKNKIPQNKPFECTNCGISFEIWMRVSASLHYNSDLAIVFISYNPVVSMHLGIAGMQRSFLVRKSSRFYVRLMLAITAEIQFPCSNALHKHNKTAL